MSYEPVRIAILGIGSVRPAVPLIFSLGTYFGEAPLHLMFWDPDEERLDLFDLFARRVFEFQHSQHKLRSSIEPEDVYEFQPDRWIVCMEARQSRKRAQSVEKLLLPFLESPPSSLTLNLMAHPLPWLGSAAQVAWPQESCDERSMPHQILRWVNSEEYFVEELNFWETSPLHSWLDSPEGVWPA